MNIEEILEILEKDSRINEEQIAIMLDISKDKVCEAIKEFAPAVYQELDK